MALNVVFSAARPQSCLSDPTHPKPIRGTSISFGSVSELSDFPTSVGEWNDYQELQFADSRTVLGIENLEIDGLGAEMVIESIDPAAYGQNAPGNLENVPERHVFVTKNNVTYKASLYAPSEVQDNGLELFEKFLRSIRFVD